MRAHVASYSLLLLLTACSGGSKPAHKPVDQQLANDGGNSEAARDKQRRALAAQIVPEGSTCLPASLKADNAPHLELAAIGKDAVVCAIDDDRARLLGPIACWRVNLASGDLMPKETEPLPGRSIAVLIEGRCARGYCLPKDAKLGDGKVAYLARNLDATKVAVLFGDDVHIFTAEPKHHESAFSIRGDKGVTNDPTAVHFVGDTILVEASDHGPNAGVWVFKADGTAIGPVASLGGKQEKPLSTYRGSFSILDKGRIGVAEKAMETLTTYEVETGKRAKLVRKPIKVVCKPAELDAYWVGGDNVPDKCKESIQQTSGHLIGATVVAGAKSLLVMLRGARLGELAVMDAKTLVEKSTIKLKWCDGSGGSKTP